MPFDFINLWLITDRHRHCTRGLGWRIHCGVKVTESSTNKRHISFMRSVRTSHLLLSSEISRPSSARVSARSLMGSPRCDFTLIRKVAFPARTRCVSRQTVSRRMSASGASVAFPPCPPHFLMTHKTAALSHSSRTSSLMAADCNANTTPPNSGLFELVPSFSLPTRAHLSASSP